MSILCNVNFHFGRRKDKFPFSFFFRIIKILCRFMNIPFKHHCIFTSCCSWSFWFNPTNLLNRLLSFLTFCCHFSFHVVGVTPTTKVGWIKDYSIAKINLEKFSITTINFHWFSFIDIIYFPFWFDIDWAIFSWLFSWLLTRSVFDRSFIVPEKLFQVCSALGCFTNQLSNSRIVSVSLGPIAYYEIEYELVGNWYLKLTQEL